MVQLAVHQERKELPDNLKCNVPPKGSKAPEHNEILSYNRPPNTT